MQRKYQPSTLKQLKEQNPNINFGNPIKIPQTEENLRRNREFLEFCRNLNQRYELTKEINSGPYAA